MEFGYLGFVLMVGFLARFVFSGLGLDLTFALIVWNLMLFCLGMMCLGFHGL